MERDRDNILFSADEQKEFSVPASISIPSALETATAFAEVASMLQAQITEDATSVEDSNSEVVVRTGYRAMRAERLTLFSNQIVEAAFRDDPTS